MKRFYDVQAPNAMTSDEIVAAIMAGNATAMQWYVATHPGTQIPTNPNAPIYEGYVPGGRVSIPQSSLVVIGLIFVGAVILWKS